jgi:hypothetical protein
LKQRLGTDGSTLFKLTWKEKATPLQRQVALLRASALHIAVTGRGSLPTPSGTNNHGKNHTVGRLDEWGGEQQPFPWDTSWASALCKFRVVDDGTTYGVAAVNAPRNAIVPQVAQVFIEAYLDAVA